MTSVHLIACVAAIIGRLTPFHLISIQNLVLVSCGVSLPHFWRRRFRDWYAWHLRLMSYSYIALAATGFR